jgi:hypothetical protein
VRVPLWAAELAKVFWQYAGDEEPFPRSLRESILRAMPITVEPIPRLTVAKAQQWLRRNGIDHGFAGSNRPLRGCLLARGGHAVLFLDSQDPEDEQRFTQAHELAHFLRDYWRPRQLALERLGPQTLEVIDGKRPPTAEERLGALLRQVHLGFHLHLMDRDERRRPANRESEDAEDCADRLGWELLAPAEHVAAHHAPAGLKMALCRYYGLPETQADRYARQLVGELPRLEAWLTSLRNPVRS